MNIPISGQVGILNSGDSPTSWMQNNLAVLGPRTLRELCIPGSHDAGMSTRTGGTAFGKECNTLTQTLGILGQLSQGARYFDIRPVISGGHYYTGHYSFVGAINSWQGANGQPIQSIDGQSVQSIISDINNYTASNQELIVLSLSSDRDTDQSSYPPFTQEQWNTLLSMLEGINNRYIAPNPTTVDLTQLSLQHFIGNSQAAVIVVVDPNGSGISLGDYASKGFYSPSSLNVYNEYSNTNDFDTMANDQLAKMKTQRTSPDSPCFLLSWTLTQSDGQAVACGLPSPFNAGCISIVDLANTANPALCGKLWPACTSQCYPNILYTDNVNTSVFAALALAINFMAISGNPVPSGSPYLPSGSYLINSQNISITLNATCQNVNGQSVPSSLTYEASQLGPVFDIHNTNGQLGLSVQSGVPNKPVPSGSPFIPSGSYALTSQQISVTISASCQNMQGQWVPSTLTFTADEASSITDINNINGQLGLTKV